MDFLPKPAIPSPTSGETEFRIAIWGPLITFLIFLFGLLIGVALFIHSYRVSVTWGMVLSGLYVLFMWWLCSLLWRAFMATLSPANWLARIGPGGIVLKYRSYLHDDSPGEDPIAVRLSWAEIADAQLQKEIHTTFDIDEKRDTNRWFLAMKLNTPSHDLERIKSAIAYEQQRKPAHIKVDDLKHELFQARKNRATASEIARIKQQIASEKKRHPGKHNKTQFRDRPIVFINPDQLRMEWTHITPGKKKLRQLLAQYTTVTDDQTQRIDTTRKLTEKEFQTSLAILLKRNETIEAVKLIKTHLGLSTTDARAYIEQQRQQ